MCASEKFASIKRRESDRRRCSRRRRSPFKSTSSFSCFNGEQRRNKQNAEAIVAKECRLSDVARSAQTAAAASHYSVTDGEKGGGKEGESERKKSTSFLSDMSPFHLRLFSAVRDVGSFRPLKLVFTVAVAVVLLLFPLLFFLLHPSCCLARFELFSLGKFLILALLPLKTLPLSSSLFLSFLKLS